MPRIFVNSQLCILIALFSTVLMGEVPQHVRVSIDRITGGQGAYVPDDEVYKVVLPREEATIVWDYQTLSPNLGLNSVGDFQTSDSQASDTHGPTLVA
jgi:hypothetical protein